MVTTRDKKADRHKAPPRNDPVLADLHRAEEHYLDLERRHEEQAAELKKAQAALLRAEKEAARLRRELENARQDADRERKEADRQRAQARERLAILKQIHSSLYSGNVFDLILRACLSLTGAQRGLYVTAREGGEKLRVRATVDVGGDPRAPSEFVRALCRQVLDGDDPVICNDGRWRGAGAGSQGAGFRNFVAAPVVLRQNLSGIVIVADKAHGAFEDQDVDTLVHIGSHAAVAVENVQLRRQLEASYLATIGVLADAMEAKDPYTHGHCEMVSRYARMIAESLGLSEHERSVVCYAALLHDIGKIGVSDGVLNKPGPLLPEERELVRSHVRVGHDLIRQVPVLKEVADVVLRHHEWYDGSGYPDGLSGEEIPMAARVVAAVDAYAAMVTGRSYKEAYSEEKARKELKRCAGTQFDPKVVEAFLTILDGPEVDEFEDGEPDCGLPPGFPHGRLPQSEAAAKNSTQGTT